MLDIYIGGLLKMILLATMEYKSSKLPPYTSVASSVLDHDVCIIYTLQASLHITWLLCYMHVPSSIMLPGYIVHNMLLIVG